MKKFSYLLFIAAFATVLATGCGQKPKDMLAKKWSFKEVDKKDLDAMMAKQTEQTKKMLESITDPAQKAEAEARMKEEMAKAPEMIAKMFKDMGMEFKSDGSCEMTGGMGGKTEKGKWELSEDGKKLTITDDKGKKDFDLSKLTAEEMTMRMKEGEMEMGLTFTAAK